MRRPPATRVVTFPTVPDKPALEGVHTARMFLDSLRKQGWEPGQVPESVVFTYAHFELYLATKPELYTPNHMIGSGPGRFFVVNSSDGRVGINCLGIGAPGAAGQLEVMRELGVRRCVSIGTAGGMQPDQEVGQLVLLTGAVRDEGTSYHYLPADAPAEPDTQLTARYATALGAAGLRLTRGSTVTTDAPYRTTSEDLQLHRGTEVRAVEMEAAALFAVGQVRDLPVASAVILDAVPDAAGSSFQFERGRAGQALRELLSVTVRFLTDHP